MTPGARAAAAIELLTELSSGNSPADVMLRAYMAKRRYIGSKDRRAIQDIFFGIIRNRGALEWHVSRHAATTARNLVIAFLIMVDKADITGIFTGDGYSPSPLSDDESKIAAALKESGLLSEEMPDSARYNLPEWWVGEIKSAYPDMWREILEHSLEEAETDIRVNSLRSSRPRIMAELASSGIKATELAFLKNGIRVSERPNLAESIKSGCMEIQDAASQLVSRIINAKPGDNVLDYCAGAGGKSLAMAAAMNNTGHITACDIVPSRLEELRHRRDRSGCSIIKTALITPYLNLPENNFDIVVVDAPCSGSGTWRRHPDSRWRYEDASSFIPLQREIMSAAARFVKPDGLLFYITCSLLPLENRNQAEWFAINNKSFIPEPLTEFVNNLGLKDSVSADIGLQILPHLLKSDALYIVSFRKTAAS